MKAIHVFLEVDFRQQHKGLTATAAKAGLRLDAKGPGVCAVFLNKKLNKARVLSSNGVLMYAHFDDGIDSTSLNIFTDAVRPGMAMSIAPYARKVLEKALRGLEEAREIA